MAESPDVEAIFFWADGLPVCAKMEEVVQVLEKKHPSVRFRRVNADDLEDATAAALTSKHKVDSVPTILIISNGGIQSRIEGYNPPALSAALEQLAGAAKPASSEDPLTQRVKSLIGQSKVMLFMKGSPDTPKCGFSNKIVGLIKAQGVAFGSFDILADEAVRQRLKEYSNWPTYPQLYVNSELVGGLDVVTELIESGEFADMLK
ncbi:MAG: Grx4 family monothiol glutaredoxin [archaeon]|nr:Grx4 family monothiol glutaredoxin [archaeon]